MLKRFLVVFIIIVFIAQTAMSVAQETDFRFSNWPLADFDGRRIINPFSESHFGIDIAAAEGEEIQAVADGKVYWTYSGGSHGISVGIEHPNGWRTTYLHLSERLVKKGEEVKATEVIGKTGVTGNGRDADEPHLHFALITDAGADVSDYSRRYGDPLAYGPADQKPAEQPIGQPAEQAQPVITISGKVPVLVPRAMNQSIAEKQLSHDQPFQQSGQQLVVKPVPQSSATYIKSINIKPITSSSKIFDKALKPSLTKIREIDRKMPQTNTSIESSKSGSKGLIVIYWLLLAAIGYLYYLANRIKPKTMRLISMKHSRF